MFIAWLESSDIIVLFGSKAGNAFARHNGWGAFRAVVAVRTSVIQAIKTNHRVLYEVFKLHLYKIVTLNLNYECLIVLIYGHTHTGHRGYVTVMYLFIYLFKQYTHYEGFLIGYETVSV